MKNQVWEYSGYEYAERPKAFRWEGDRLEIDKILDRWRTPGKKGVRVRVPDEREWSLCSNSVPYHLRRSCAHLAGSYRCPTRCVTLPDSPLTRLLVP